MQQIDINPGSATTILINVDGTTVNWSTSGNMVGNFTNSNWRGKILWNFPTATTLNFGSHNMMGQVLAPNADVTSSANIDGSIAAKSISTTSEIHQPTANLTFDCTNTQPTPTPTNTPTATATDEPTATPTNTATNTPLPTSTGTATSTPVPPTETPDIKLTNTPPPPPCDCRQAVIEVKTENGVSTATWSVQIYQAIQFSIIDANNNVIKDWTPAQPGTLSYVHTPLQSGLWYYVHIRYTDNGVVKEELCLSYRVTPTNLPETDPPQAPPKYYLPLIMR